MASGFWYLEDGRGFCRRWSWMNYMLKLINDEIKLLDGAEDFYNYLIKLVMTDEDEYNGFGGFFREGIEGSIMFVFDLREFTPENRAYFWKATQMALAKLIKNDSEKEEIIFLIKILLKMHKAIKRRENPELLNHLIITQPYSGERKGPGWESY
ncbi:hypothetical protein GCM10007424_01630 [Flavobacterium suaedae]|uniref:Uncharacterized protein n=1 Tax=Flavobacterium suaedae TaxID=1767027 RepID=A0ABQ1JCE9_9FLAO|nr:hypothetical protein [Flavobacterium suaedae]GGB65377.1 hypothetical protein GCM10007424_01630 [Flavobacterium suaedae]